MFFFLMSQISMHKNGKIMLYSDRETKKELFYLKTTLVALGAKNSYLH